MPSLSVLVGPPANVAVVACTQIPASGVWLALRTVPVIELAATSSASMFVTVAPAVRLIVTASSIVRLACHNWREYGPTWLQSSNTTLTSIAASPESMYVPVKPKYFILKPHRP